MNRMTKTSKLTQLLLTSMVCAAALVIASCGGTVRYPKYYTLEIPTSLKPAPGRA